MVCCSAAESKQRLWQCSVHAALGAARDRDAAASDVDGKQGSDVTSSVVGNSKLPGELEATQPPFNQVDNSQGSEEVYIAVCTELEPPVGPDEGRKVRLE